MHRKEKMGAHAQHMSSHRPAEGRITMQALGQRVHGYAALSVTESGKFSLVDQILQEDYTPASRTLPPKVLTDTSFILSAARRHGH